MVGLLVKLVVCPIGVLLASYIFPNVYYPSLYQPIVIGVLVALAGHVMELYVLEKGTLWMSTVMDFGAATLIVYFASMFFTGAAVTFFGAILTGILLAVTEYFQHRWLIQSGRTKKTAINEDK